MCCSGRQYQNDQPYFKSDIMFIKILFSLLVLSFSLAGSLKTYAFRGPPNIIFILVDDMGYYDLSSYGASEIKSTQIDKLAAEGIRFTDFYAAAPICSPSRAGLLTGCYPRRTGNHIWVHRPDSELGIAPDELTMAELFKKNGYQTACVGKWHLGFEEPFLPHNQGFDHYFGILHNLDPHETVHYQDTGGIPVIRNGAVVDRPANPAELASLYTDEAIRLITSWVKGNLDTNQSESNKETAPFFLYLPHTTLHHPLGVSKEFTGTSDWGKYGDAIHELDYHTGRLMDKLKALQIQDNTIVIFMSDNGRGPGRNADQPIRGSKLSTFEGGFRVPCIIWGPGFGIEKGITSNVLAHAMDWFPTLMSLAGIEIPGNIILDGRDLSSLITGTFDQSSGLLNNSTSLNANIPMRRYWNPGREWSERITREDYLNAFFYHGSTGALAAVRSGKWKLHLNPNLKLYDLDIDPGERQPVNDSKMKWKMRGMAVLFQEEMLLTSRPAGKTLPGFR